jgi:hypothetical protein
MVSTAGTLPAPTLEVPVDIRFEKAETVNGHPANVGDFDVFVKKTADVLGHWAPSADAFGPAEWTHIGWVTKTGSSKWVFLKPNALGWGPHRPTREQATLAVIF